MLKECIDSLLNQSFPLKKIVVVNSNSTDGTNEMLKQYVPYVKIIDGFNTWWWAKCMNAGITYSLENGADYILAMNDDTCLDYYCLEYLIDTSRSFPEVIVGSIVKDKQFNGKIINQGIGAKYTKFRWIPFKKVLGNVNGREVFYTEGHSGRGVIFPVSVYKHVGLYDDLNFPQHADRDYSYRCLKLGVGQCIDSHAVTFLNFNTTQFGMSEARLTFAEIKNVLFNVKGIYNLKNQFRFLRKHYSFLWPFWFALWLAYISVVIITRMLPGGTLIIRKFTNSYFYVFK